MSIKQESGPTFILRKLCQKIQIQIQQIIKTQQILPVNSNQPLNQKPTNSQQLIQYLKNSLIRIITSQLPQVVSYQYKQNDKLQQYQQELIELKKLYKIQKHNHQSLCIQNDTLKMTIFQINNKFNQQEHAKDYLQNQYNQAMAMLTQYIRRNQNQQESLAEKDKLNQYLKQQITQLNKKLVQVNHQNQQQINNPNPKQQKLKNLPLQISEKPQPNQISNQIIVCQKQLLQYQLKQSQKQLQTLQQKLNQQTSYSNNLQSQLKQIQKISIGEKVLNQNLQKEIYLLVNTNNQIKIQILEFKKRNAQLEDEMAEIQEAYQSSNIDKLRLQTSIKQYTYKINNLQKVQQQNHTLNDKINELKNKLQISQLKYQQLRDLKQELQQRVQQFKQKLQQLASKQTQQMQRACQLQSMIKHQSSLKLANLQQMSVSIKQKYQQKLSLIQNYHTELKQKYKLLKKQNQRLYQGIDIRVKKQMKLDIISNKLKIKNQSLVNQVNQLTNTMEKIVKDMETLKRQNSIVDGRNQQLKKELQVLEIDHIKMKRKLRKLQIHIFPHIIKQIKFLKLENQKLKQNFSSFKILQLKQTQDVIIQMKQKFLIFNNKNNEQKNQLVKILQEKKQQQKKQNNKIQFQRSQSQKLIEQIKKKSQYIDELTKKLQNLQYINKNLQQINKNLQQSNSIFQLKVKNYVIQIQQLVEKLRQTDKLNQMISELNKQNMNLKQNIYKRQIIQSNKKSNTQQNLRKNNLSEQRTLSQTKNSNSCIHLKPSHPIPPPKTYIQSKPFLYKPNKNNQSSLKTILRTNAFHYDEPTFRQFNNEEIRIQEDFQNQRQRLEQIKREYQQMVSDKRQIEQGLVNNIY